MVASEIAKAQSNRGKRRELYYFRDHQGLEVDFVIPGGGDRRGIGTAGNPIRALISEEELEAWA